MSTSKDPARDDDLSDEIRRTMAEAEAAVSALEDGEQTKRHPTGERRAVVDDEEPAVPEPTMDVPSELAAAVVEIEAELDATKDRWLRAVADLENFKKRVKRETDEAVTRAIQSLLPSFLPTMDNLERALEVASSAKGDQHEQLVQGIAMVRDEFMSALRKHGIEAVESVGVPFDPSVHDALQQFDSPDHPPGMIIREFERGYRLGDRLLRPARVIIAGPGSTGKG